MARRPNRRATRSLFTNAVSDHTSGDQVQDIDLSNVNTAAPTESAPQAAPATQEIDLTDVPTTPRSQREARPSSEQLSAENKANDLEYQRYLLADTKAKNIRNRDDFKPGNGFYTLGADPSEHGQALKAVKEGKATLKPITATNGFAHVKNVYKELSSFVSNIGPVLRAKAAAHDKAADDIAKIDPEHPEIQTHRGQAAQIREFLGEGPDVRNNLREIRDSGAPAATGSTTQDGSRSLERKLIPIKNALVEAQAKVDSIPTTQKEAAAGLGVAGQLSQNTKRTHGKIKQAHSALTSLHGQINRMLRPLGVGTPTGPAYMELQGQRLDSLQDKPKAVDYSNYQDVRHDLEPGVEGRLSKPGHIWGDAAVLGGRKTGEREQIKIGDEGIKDLKSRKGGQAKLHLSRMRTIMRTGRSPEEATAETDENRETSLFAYTPEAEENRLIQAKAAGRVINTSEGSTVIAGSGAPRTQKREGNTVKSVAIDPRRITTAGTFGANVAQIAAERGKVQAHEEHIKNAVRSLIDTGELADESAAYLRSLPAEEAEKTAQTIMDRHKAHSDALASAVKSLSSTGKLTKTQRDVFKREGTDPVQVIKLARGK